MYDIIVIGAGPGGYVGAIKAAQLGMKTALVERDLVGGTCLNRGCIPTKALMHCADLFCETAELGSFGINVAQPGFDFAAMHDYKNASVDTLRKGVEQLVAGNGIELICGNAVITSPNTVNVGGTDYSAKHIMIATGSRPAIPPIPGAELAGVYSSDGILEGHGVDTKRLVIVGGGVIGAEIAQIYSELGCKVTIVEALDRILPMMDREISQNLSMIFKKRSIDVFASAKVEAIESAEPLRVVFTQRNAQKSVDCDSVLICTGRRPNVEGIMGEGLELALNGRFIAVNDRYETSIPSILAVGDCNGKLQLAHAAEAQAICAVEMLAGREPSIRADLVPSCVYTKPEIACTGITADEAKARGIAVRLGKYVMGGNAKSIIEKAERSYIKLVFDAESDVLLGAQLMCHRATDMIAELNLALANGLTSRELMLSLRPHPSFAEAVTEAVEASHGASIHTMPPKTRR